MCTCSRRQFLKGVGAGLAVCAPGPSAVAALDEQQRFLVAEALRMSVTAASADPRRFGSGRGATETPYIDATQAQQRAQIEQGRRNGQLTRSEYHQLMAEQDRIAAMERRAKADRVADPVERRRIREAQEAAARHIYHESHDNETRWNRWYRRWW